MGNDGKSWIQGYLWAELGKPMQVQASERRQEILDSRLSASWAVLVYASGRRREIVNSGLLKGWTTQFDVSVGKRATTENLGFSAIGRPG